jgi:predicted DNA-binding transcriptional regulator AlpA
MTETVNLTDIARTLGVSRPTAYQYVRSVGFPLPIAVGPRPDGRTTPRRWKLDDVKAWQAAQRNDN